MQTIKNYGAPTSSIICAVGDLYYDTNTDRLYRCVKIETIPGSGAIIGDVRMATWVEYVPANGGSEKPVEPEVTKYTATLSSDGVVSISPRPAKYVYTLARMHTVNGKTIEEAVGTYQYNGNDKHDIVALRAGKYAFEGKCYDAFGNVIAKQESNIVTTAEDFAFEVTLGEDKIVRITPNINSGEFGDPYYFQYNVYCGGHMRKSEEGSFEYDLNPIIGGDMPGLTYKVDCKLYKRGGLNPVCLAELSTGDVVFPEPEPDVQGPAFEATLDESGKVRVTLTDPNDRRAIVWYYQILRDSNTITQIGPAAYKEFTVSEMDEVKGIYQVICTAYDFNTDKLIDTGCTNTVEVAGAVFNAVLNADKTVTVTPSSPSFGAKYALYHDDRCIFTTDLSRFTYDFSKQITSGGRYHVCCDIVHHKYGKVDSVITNYATFGESIPEYFIEFDDNNVAHVVPDDGYSVDYEIYMGDQLIQSFWGQPYTLDVSEYASLGGHSVRAIVYDRSDDPPTFRGECVSSISKSGSWLFEDKYITLDANVDLPAPTPGVTYTMVGMWNGVVQDLATATCQADGSIMFNYAYELVLVYDSNGWRLSYDGTTPEHFLSVRANG